MRRADDELSDAHIEATKAELRRVIADRMFRDTERVPFQNELREPWVGPRPARLSEGVQFWLIGLLVVVGALLAASLMEPTDEPCTLTMAVGYPECKEDLVGPGFVLEWPWSAD